MILARFVTDFADEAVLLPLAASVALLFFATGWWRGALAWVLAVSGTLGTMLVLKLVTLACAPCVFGPGFVSPSGHTAGGGMIYGSLLALVLRRFDRSVGLAIALSLLAAAAFGVSRLVLGVHSVPEVIGGGLVGVLGATVFALGSGPVRVTVRAWQLLVVAGLAGLALHGTHMPAEASIRGAAAGFWPGCRTCE